MAVEAVQRHGGVRQANHPHASRGDVRQHRLVPAPPPLLLALGLPASTLEAPAVRAEQEVPGRGGRCPDALCQNPRDPSAAAGRTQQDGEQHAGGVRLTWMEDKQLH